MLNFNGRNIPDFVKVKSVKVQTLPVVTNNLKQIVGASGKLCGRTSLGEKLVECEIVIVIPEGETLQSCGRVLSVWLRGDGFKLSPLIIEDDPTVRYMAKVNNSAELSDLLFVGSGTIQFIVPSGDSEAVVEKAASGVKRLEVNNEGTKTTFPIITAVVGTAVTNGTILFQNVTTGDKVVLNGTFRSGQSITVDCQKNLVKVDDKINLKVINLESHFFDLAEGINVLQCQNEGTSLSVTFRERYL